MNRFTTDFDDFGSYLKYLRHRAGMKQRDLGLAVGYGEAQISRLEHNRRLPEIFVLTAKFIPALGLEAKPELANRLLELAHQARSKDEGGLVFSEEMGALEAVPIFENGELLRPDKLNFLEALFRENQAVQVFGFPGTGKTVLAAAYIRTIIGSQTVFWHSINGSDSSPLETLIRQLALFLVSQGQMEAALFTQPLSVSPEIALSSLAEQLRSIKAFICIDALHHLKAYPPLEDLIDHSHCKFLLLSREELSLRDVKSTFLEGLDETEAGSLLQSIGLSIPANTLRTLVRLTGGNPMLLGLVGAKILDNPPRMNQFIEQLATQKEVTAFLMESAMEGLSDHAANLLSLIAIFRKPLNLFDADLSARLREQGLVGDLAEAITTLQKRRFFENPSDALLHPLVHEYLGLTLHTQPELFRKLHWFAAEYYRSTGMNAVETLYHFSHSNKVDETLLFLQDTVLGLDSTGQGEAAADLISALINRTQNTALLSPDQEVQFRSLRGQLLMSGSQAGEAEAEFRRALALAIRAGIAKDIHGSLLVKLARFLLQRGKVPEADQLCDEAETNSAPEPYSGFNAETCAVRCIVRLMQSRFGESADMAKEALKLAEPLTHRDFRLVSGVQTMAYNTLGILAHIQRDIPSALANWRKAEESAMLANNLRTALRIKGNIGALLFDQGELDDSRQVYEGILDAVQALGDVFTLGKILNALGAIYLLQDRSEEALEILHRARQVKRMIGDLQGEATTDNQLAQVMLASGKAQNALRIMERLLKQTESTGEMRWRASYLDTTGTILLALKDYEGARESIEEAVSLPGVQSDPQLNTYLRNHLALAYVCLGNLSKAQEIFERSEGVMTIGIVSVESCLVQAFLFAADGDMVAAQIQLSSMERAAKDLSLHFYSRMAISAMDHLSNGLPVPTCVSLAMDSKDFHV